MNEYIKKFWEENGYEVREELYGAPKKEMSAVKWDMNKDIFYILPVYNPNADEYYYENSYYSEDEMLRIIKMKIFL